MKTIHDISAKTGIGFRKDFAEDFLNLDILKPSFVEFAPENGLNMGGYWKKILNQVSEKYPVVCHGLSLSIGSPDELDWNFLKQLKKFFKEHNVLLYSEHLSYSKCDNAHLYDLLPIPFRMDAVSHISERIKEVQDFLEMKIAIENVSYYTPVAAQMTEWEFISEIVDRSGCNLLLDVNNVFVNSFNHTYEPKEFIHKLPLDRVAYIHMAGHLQVAEDLIIDTHGEPIIDPVYDLFEYTIRKLKPVPVLLERDFNIPELEELQGEMNHLQKICNKQWTLNYAGN
jgi:uncharacterized protein (UPF0276 family)